SVVVSVVDAPPIANDDSYSSTANNPFTMASPGVLANDTDADGDTLSAVAMSRPAHGSLVWGADGSCTYAPDHNFAGADSFTYVASDGTSRSNVANVTIDVASTPPIAADDGPYTMTENNPLTIGVPGVLGNDSESHGDPLTPKIVAGPGHGTA